MRTMKYLLLVSLLLGVVCGTTSCFVVLKNEPGTKMRMAQKLKESPSSVYHEYGDNKKTPQRQLKLNAQLITKKTK